MYHVFLFFISVFMVSNLPPIVLDIILILLTELLTEIELKAVLALMFSLNLTVIVSVS